MEELVRELESDATVIAATDGRIRKRVVVAGHGDRPPKYARCLVHYRVWIYAHEDNSSSGGGAAAGTVVWSPTADAVLDSQAEKKQQPTEIVLNRFTHATPAGGARDIAALGRIVETMAANETCLAIAASEYCYGERGNFSFPHVPPHSTLLLQVTLLAFEVPADIDSKQLVTYEDRAEAADRRRLEGNELYKSSDTTGAKAKYLLAISLLDDDLLFQLEGEYRKHCLSIRNPLLLNLSAVCLKEEEFDGVIDYTSKERWRRIHGGGGGCLSLSICWAERKSSLVRKADIGLRCFGIEPRCWRKTPTTQRPCTEEDLQSED